MNTSPNQPDDNALAYAGVSLLGNQSRGQAPDWQELSAWRAGTLSDSRATEILSHIANDPEVFQQWLDMSEAEQWVAIEAAEYAANSASNELSAEHPAGQGSTSGDSGLSQALNAGMEWFRSLTQKPLPVYGGAMAALVLAVLISPLMKQGDTLRQQLDRSSDTFVGDAIGLPAVTPVSLNTKGLGGLFDDLTTADVDRHNYQLGLQQAVELLGTDDSATWQDWSQQLPTEAVDCTKALDATHCTRAEDDLRVLGQWSLMTYAACQQPLLVGDAYWEKQYALYDAITRSPHVRNSELFSPVARDLPGRTPTALCSIVSQLIAAGN